MPSVAKHRRLDSKFATLGVSTKPVVPKKWMIQTQMMPVRAPVTTAHRGRSMHGSIYLDEHESGGLMASNLKFELIGTSVQKHQDSATQCKGTSPYNHYRRTVTDSKKQYPKQSAGTNTSNLNVAGDTGH